MKNIRVITFDAGGTLLYPYPSVGSIYAEVLSAHGVDLSPNILESGFRQAWMEAHANPRVSINEHSERDWWRAVVLRTLQGQRTPENFDLFFDALWIAFAHPERWKLYDKTLETLAELKQRGYQLALLSNWDERLRSLVRGLQLDAYFDQLFISSEMGVEKPDSRIFKKVEEVVQISGDQILHVGDSLHHDVKGAQAAGWNVYHLTHRPDTERKIHEIATLSELLDLLPGKN